MIHSATPVPVPSRAVLPRWSETLRDRSRVLIRPLERHDREAERAFIEGLSPRSRRFRFLGQVGHPSEALLDALTDADPAQAAAFAAVATDRGAGRIVGVSRYAPCDEAGRCECAIVVDDAWQDRGLGTVLMRHLIDQARARGVRTLYSVDSAENIAMHHLAAFLGFRTRPDPDDSSQLIHELAL